jgi:hypothetical protein
MDTKGHPPVQFKVGPRGKPACGLRRHDAHDIVEMETDGGLLESDRLSGMRQWHASAGQSALSELKPCSTAAAFWRSFVRLPCLQYMP